MQKLVSELTRLYVPAGTLSPALLAQHLQGQTSLAVDLIADDGRTRAIVMPFHKLANSEEAQHWDRLCVVANALQTQLGLPAPAVSISGGSGYYLWLSLETAAPTALVHEFLELVRKAYAPEMAAGPDVAGAPVALPPRLDQGTGKWAAFIHPGLGASFADESGLEMAPPFAGQAALLEGLESIGEAQFAQALATLRQSHGGRDTVSTPLPARATAPDGLLLRDATLEDIVRFLHAKNIEPTFRHLIPMPLT